MEHLHLPHWNFPLFVYVNLQANMREYIYVYIHTELLVVILIIVNDFLQPGCAFDGSSFHITFYGTIIVMLTLFAVSMALLPIIGVIRRAYLVRRRGVNVANKVMQWYKTRMIRAIFVIVTFLYLNATTIAIVGVDCVTDGTGALVLQADASIRCYEADHYLISIISWMIIFVITIGYPIFIIVFLLRNQKNLKDHLILATYGMGGLLWIYELRSPSLISGRLYL